MRRQNLSRDERKGSKNGEEEETEAGERKEGLREGVKQK